MTLFAAISNIFELALYIQFAMTFDVVQIEKKTTTIGPSDLKSKGKKFKITRFSIAY